MTDMIKPLSNKLAQYGLGVAVVTASLLAACVNVLHPLYEPAAAGDVGRVRKLLAQGADVNHASYLGITALHRAAENGDTDMVKLLLAHGAAVNAKTQHMHATPLHVAVSKGFRETVEILLAHGAAVDAKLNPYSVGRFLTPLELAVLGGHKDIVEILLAHGAPVNTTTRYLFAKEDLVVRPPRSGSYGFGLDRFVTLRHGPPLCGVVWVYRVSHRPGRVRGPGPCLLNAQPGISSCRGPTEYHCRVGDRLTRISGGETALHVAARLDRKDIADPLLANGAVAGAMNPVGQKAWDLAVHNGHLEIAEMLSRHP